jgi:hypothetical protein
MQATVVNVVHADWSPVPKTDDIASLLRDSQPCTKPRSADIDQLAYRTAVQDLASSDITSETCDQVDAISIDSRASGYGVPDRARCSFDSKFR